MKDSVDPPGRELILQGRTGSHRTLTSMLSLGDQRGDFRAGRIVGIWIGLAPRAFVGKERAGKRIKVSCFTRSVGVEATWSW